MPLPPRLTATNSCNCASALDCCRECARALDCCRKCATGCASALDWCRECATGCASALDCCRTGSMSEYHRKRIRHFEQSRHLHELTFSCYSRRALLTNDQWQRVLAKSLSAACRDEQFRLVAFVFMPEHVHLLVLPKTSESKVSRLLARTKQPTSKQIRQLLEEQDSPLLQQLLVRERAGKYCFRFWQAGPGFDRNVFSAEAVAASIDYIHTNPVKRGLCSAAVDFKWSSCRFHLQNQIEDDLPKLSRPDPDWFDTAGTIVASP